MSLKICWEHGVDLTFCFFFLSFCIFLKIKIESMLFEVTNFRKRSQANKHLVLFNSTINKAGQLLQLKQIYELSTRTYLCPVMLLLNSYHNIIIYPFRITYSFRIKYCYNKFNTTN